MLFERELLRIDHPLTSLHPDEVDDYANTQVIIMRNLGSPVESAHGEIATNELFPKPTATNYFHPWGGHTCEFGT